MDRPTTRKDADARSSRQQPHEAFVLPSRRSALDLCRSQLKVSSPGDPASGPILLTGDAGVGKTWLWRRLELESPANMRWVGVDLTPSNTPADFYHLISHEIGLGERCPTSTSRVELIDFLSERRADGHRLTLVIDEAQNLSTAVWEEVRILANRIDRPGGFSRMILVGQTSLARRFGTHPFAAIEARLISKIHLGPIDADEAVDLVAAVAPALGLSESEVESLHRDSGGNVRKLLRKLGTVQARPLEVTTESIDPQKHKSVETLIVPRVTSESYSTALVPGPLTGPARPPLRVDENMIEVGWSPDDSSDASESSGVNGRLLAATGPTEGGEEAVHDHYAALQAWREWAENQSRRAQPSLISADDVSGPLSSIDPEDEDEIEEELDELPVARPERMRVRIEGEQKFAPFGQLFSRMAQSHDPE